MKGLLFLPLAEIDIDGIWDYSADNWGPDQADRCTDEIRDACQALASGTKRGRPVDIRPGYQKIVTGSHVVYFRESADLVEVVRILHGRQDTERHL